MSKAEELAKKTAADICNLSLAKAPSTVILAALHEYGALVRKRDAEVCGKPAAGCL